MRGRAASATRRPLKLVRGPACLRRTPRYCAWSCPKTGTCFSGPSVVLKYQPACKPGSVGRCALARAARDGHSSGTMIAHGLKQPTRTASLTSPCGVIARKRTDRVAVPIRFCSRWGLPCRLRCRIRGALLPHLFTLTAPTLFREKTRRFVLCGTVPEAAPRFREDRPRRMLSGTACRWSPDFPPSQPFGHSESGRPAD